MSAKGNLGIGELDRADDRVIELLGVREDGMSRALATFGKVACAVLLNN